MKRLALLSLLVASAAFGQSPGELNCGLRIDRDNDAISLSWWGETGRKYFVMQSEDLVHWRSMPVIEAGTANVISWGVASNADRLFFKLVHTEHDGSDPMISDSDNDGVSDGTEVQDGTNPFREDTDGDGWFDDEEKKANTNPLSGIEHPALLPAEEYVRAEIRSVYAAYGETGGDHTTQSWDWIWSATDPPTGSWTANSPGNISHIREIGGLATFSDGREGVSLGSPQAGEAALNEVANMQSGQEQNISGFWRVNSSYFETPQGTPPVPPDDPVYPEGGHYEGEWPHLPVIGWQGGALEFRFVWSSDSPRAGRMTHVSRTYLKRRSENQETKEISVHTIMIKPGALNSAFGGPADDGMIPIKANVGTDVSVMGIQLEESLSVFEFEDEELWSGLDKVSPEKWLMVPQDGENRIYVRSAAGGTDVFKLKPSPSETTYVTAEPETLTQARLLVTFGPGGTLGDGEGMALEVNQKSTEEPVLRFAVLPPQVLKVAVHPITLLDAQGQPIATPQSVPNEADLEDYLNKVFRDQANITCEVTVLPTVGVNWDIGIGVNGSTAGANDRHFEILSPLLAGRPVSDEENAVATASPQLSSADVNVYLIATGGDNHDLAGMWVVRNTNGTNAGPVLGFAGKASNSNNGTVYVWDYPSAPDRPNHMWAIAHESAHWFGKLQHSTFPPSDDNPSFVRDTDNELRLMTGEGGEKRGISPRMLVKGEWDKLQDYFNPPP